MVVAEVAKSSVMMVHHPGRKYVGLVWRKCVLQFGDPTASSRRDVLHLIKNILPLLHSKDSSSRKGGGETSVDAEAIFSGSMHTDGCRVWG